MPEKRRLSKRTIIATILVILCIPAVMALNMLFFEDRSYYAVSLIIIALCMVPFALVFEGRKPMARELVVIAVMVAIAVAGRAAFFMVPQFKPVVAIVIIAGAALGAESGFAVGALSGFVSNFIFGQGPWTPWQMFAFGIIGFLAGLIFYRLASAIGAPSRDGSMRPAVSPAIANKSSPSLQEANTDTSLQGAPRSGQRGVKDDEAATKKSGVYVFAASAMTIGQAGKELVDFDALDRTDTLCRELTGHGVCGITEDGKTLYDYGLMEKVCEAAVQLGLPIMSHAEPEADIVRRDIGLARKTNARFHFQHISLAESLSLIRGAKAEGLPVTCETAPHYFTLTEADVELKATNAKMNPPLRTEKDRLAVIGGLIDGTIDCIATDHAPHEPAAKDLPFEEAANGVIGLETALPISYTVLVKSELISLERFVELMSIRPAEIIGLPREDAFIELDLETPYAIDVSKFRSKARNTPFDGMRVYGRIVKKVKNDI